MAPMAARKIIVVGAGAAGLTAALRLAEAGFKVQVLEARDRVGGRIWSVKDPLLDASVELGAEFIHGRPPELWRYLQPGTLDIDEGCGSFWCEDTGKLSPCDFFDQVYELLGRAESYNGPDVSFGEFLLKQNDVPDRVRLRALNYVKGFHAADPQQISVHSIAADAKAEEKIEGDRTFRFRQGYGKLVEKLHADAESAGAEFHLSHVVRQIQWVHGNVTVQVLSTDKMSTFSGGAAVITLPVGVLQSAPGSIAHVEFAPPLREKVEALDGLVAGHVARCCLIFEEQLWANQAIVGRNDLADMQFLFSDDEAFPTWWTLEPRRVPLLTAWSPALASDSLATKEPEEVVDIALTSLANILKIKKKDLRDLLRGAYTHQWISDPFSRGAYSYAKVGGLDSYRLLSLPLSDTLFFAGEATEFTGHHATVHGAIASGERVAAELKARAAR